MKNKRGGAIVLSIVIVVLLATTTVLIFLMMSKSSSLIQQKAAENDLGKKSQKGIANDTGASSSKSNIQDQAGTSTKQILVENNIAKWQKFDSLLFKFSLLYPAEMNIESNVGDLKPNESSDISIYPKDTKLGLDIATTPIPSSKEDVLNPKHYDPADVKKWDIKRIADEIWEMNKNYSDPGVRIQTVSNMEEATIAGRKAYSFKISGGYIDWEGKSRLDQEMYFVYTTTVKGYKLKISYPARDANAKKVLDTLKFY